MPRPIELTDELAIEIAGYLQLGNSIADSAALAGISESTYHNWIKRGEAGESPFVEFLQLTHAARAEAKAELVKVIQAAAVDGDWKAAAWKLERMDRKNWGRTVDVKAEHSGPGGSPIQTVIYIPENGRESTGDPTAGRSADDVSVDAG